MRFQDSYYKTFNTNSLHHIFCIFLLISTLYSHRPSGVVVVQYSESKGFYGGRLVVMDALSLTQTLQSQ